MACSWRQKLDEKKCSWTFVKKKKKNPGTQKKSGQKEALINQPGLKEPQQTQLQLMELQQNRLELTSNL